MALTKVPNELSSTPSIVDGGNATAITITSGENVLAGKTSTATLAADTTAGHTLYNIGVARHVASGSPSLQLTRTSSDGDIAVFTKDGSTVGSLATQGGEICLMAPSGGGIRVRSSMASVIPVNASRVNLDATTDLGSSSARFKDLYLSGGVNFNGSSGGINTANRSFLMDEYEIGTCTITLNTSNGDASLSRQDNATGFYQKTGDICTVQFYSGGLTFSAAGSGTARVTGLPFNNRGGTYDYGVCSVTHNTATTTDIQNGYTAPNHNFITLTQSHATAGGIWRTSGVRYFMFSITYLTT